jgi:hypothetical protein
VDFIALTSCSGAAVPVKGTFAGQSAEEGKLENLKMKQLTVSMRSQWHNRQPFKLRK